MMDINSCICFEIPFNVENNQTTNKDERVNKS